MGWRDDDRISRAADGIEKSGALQRTPKLAASKFHVQRLALNMADATPERIFCILSWALLLRARSEATNLVRASSPSFRDQFAPIESEGEIDLADGALVSRLRSRTGWGVKLS